MTSQVTTPRVGGVPVTRVNRITRLSVEHPWWVITPYRAQVALIRRSVTRHPVLSKLLDKRLRDLPDRLGWMDGRKNPHVAAASGALQNANRKNPTHRFGA